MTVLSQALRARNNQLAVAFVCFLIGLLAVMQFRTQGRIRGLEQTLAAPDSSQVIASLVEANTNLRQEVGALESRVETYQSRAGESDLENLVAELNRMKLVNGLIEASGPGVQVAITGRITTQDLQDVVNELRNAGAEAIALNNRRIVASSIIARRGEDLLLEGVPLTEPYTLQAIGQPETLERAIERKGGLIPLLRYNNPQLTIQVATKDKLILPVYEGERTFNYAQVQAER